MPTYVAFGKVLPERTNFAWPVMTFGVVWGDTQTDVYFCVLQAQIIMQVRASADMRFADLRALCSTIAGNVVNAAGFRQVRAFSHDIEAATCLETGHSEVFGVEGFVFDGGGTLGSAVSFERPSVDEGVSISAAVLLDPFFTRATFELRSAIRYPAFTALHCRLAIEAIRNAFGPDEQHSWPLMRQALVVSRDTLESFRTDAAEQRHGRNLDQSWDQRRHAMQVAWEIVHRYQRYVDENRPATISGVQNL